MLCEHAPKRALPNHARLPIIAQSPCPRPANGDLSPASKRLCEHDDVRRSRSLILVVHPLRTARRARNRRSRLLEQLHRLLVHAHDGTRRIVRGGVGRQHFLHLRDKPGGRSRHAARFIDETFSGFVPKQSRNLRHGLGLSRYDIPIDSRITIWLNEFGFPIRLTATALGDRNSFEFVSDGCQRLAEAGGLRKTWCGEDDRCTT